MSNRTSLTERLLRSLILSLTRSITQIIIQVYLSELKKIDKRAGHPFYNRREAATDDESTCESCPEIQVYHPPQRPGRDEVDNRN